MKKLQYILVLCFALMACQNATRNEKTEEKTKPESKSEATIQKQEGAFLRFECAPKDVQMFWKAEDGNVFKNFDSLDNWLQTKHHQQLVFAMNGGMYMEDNSPLGLYIEKGKSIRKLNTRNGSGNFYMKPNAVFYITKSGKAGISPRENFKEKDVLFATQSGPMALIDGAINTAFNQDSKNINIRNGVGILPNGDCLFVMSRGLVTFYEFAQFFKEQGCKNALYLDGAISQTYLPAKGYTYKGGNFGVIVAVTEKVKK